MTISDFFQYGVPTVLLVGLCYGIYLTVRKISTWAERIWDYATGSGMVVDGKQERLGVVTELKQKHFEFMSTTASTLHSQSRQLESHERHFNDLHEKLDKLVLIADSRGNIICDDPSHHKPA